MPRRESRSLDPRPRAARILRALRGAYPEARCALEHRDAFQLLVATILSAQCTDARVNQVTPALFARFPDVNALARAERGEVEALIRSTGFFRAKARSLVRMASALVEHHGGSVPHSLDDLTGLPGVGRKTANVVLGTAYGLATGVVVDTHVKRLAYRLGLTASTNPAVIERDLMGLIPRKHWVLFSHLLILHGRKVCSARKPHCSACVLETLCPKQGVTAQR